MAAGGSGCPRPLLRGFPSGRCALPRPASWRFPPRLGPAAWCSARISWGSRTRLPGTGPGLTGAAGRATHGNSRALRLGARGGSLHSGEQKRRFPRSVSRVGVPRLLPGPALLLLNPRSCRAATKRGPQLPPVSAGQPRPCTCCRGWVRCSARPSQRRPGGRTRREGCSSWAPHASAGTGGRQVLFILPKAGSAPRAVYSSRLFIMQY